MPFAPEKAFQPYFMEIISYNHFDIYLTATEP